MGRSAGQRRTDRPARTRRGGSRPPAPVELRVQPASEPLDPNDLAVLLAQWLVDDASGRIRSYVPLECLAEPERP